jgi:protoheme IX farnesyltransferase
MSDLSVETSQQHHAAAIGGGSVGDYVELMKPRVMSLSIFTAFVGLIAAPGAMHPVLAFTALLCIAVGAGAAAALNMWYDADIDAVMTRTQRRPVPEGRISAEEARTFGLTLASGAVVVLGLLVSWLAAGLLAFTIFFYVVVYTMWLKRLTPQNIVIGGAAGALPPVIGWAAAAGAVGIEPLTLFLIVFLWTPAHFWSLALVRSADYARAGVPMLPVVAGAAETRRQILIYSLVLTPCAMLPWLLGFAGPSYALVAAAMGLVFLFLAWRVFRREDQAGLTAAPRRLFGYSILYLFTLFAVLLAEQLFGLAPAAGS